MWTPGNQFIIDCKIIANCCHECVTYCFYAEAVLTSLCAWGSIPTFCSAMNSYLYYNLLLCRHLPSNYNYQVLKYIPASRQILKDKQKLKVLFVCRCVLYRAFVKLNSSLQLGDDQRNDISISIAWKCALSCMWGGRDKLQDITSTSWFAEPLICLKCWKGIEQKRKIGCYHNGNGLLFSANGEPREFLLLLFICTSFVIILISCQFGHCKVGVQMARWIWIIW